MAEESRLPFGRAFRSVKARCRHFGKHFSCRLRANAPVAFPLALGLLLLLVLDPFSFTSYADRVSRDLFVKLQSPFYDSDARDDITLVLFHENELPLFSGGDAHWPPTFKEYALIIDKVLEAGPRAVFVDLLFLDEHATGSFLGNHGIDPVDAEARVAALAGKCRDLPGCETLLPGLEQLSTEVLAELVRAIDADRLDCFATHALAGWLGNAESQADCRGWAQYGMRAEAPFVLAAPPPVSISSLGVLEPGGGADADYRGASLRGGLHPEIEQVFPERERHRPTDSAGQDEDEDEKNLARFARNSHKANVVTIEVEDRYSLALTREPGLLEDNHAGLSMDAFCRPEAVLSAAARLYLESRCGELKAAKGAERREIETEIRAFSRRITAGDRAQITIQWGLRPNLKSTRAGTKCFSVPRENGSGRLARLVAPLCGSTWCGLDAFVQLLGLGVNSNPEQRSIWGHPQPARCAYHRQMTARDAFRTSLFGQTGAFEDKYVIIGASAQAARDFHDTPTHGALPGAFFHAMALDNLLENEGRYMRSPYQYSVAGLTFSFDMLIEAGTLFFISLLFFPRNLKPVPRATIPLQQWLCRLQTLARSMLLALITVLTVVIVCAAVFDLTPVNWISLLTFTFGIAAFRASDLTAPVWALCTRPNNRVLRAARITGGVDALAALAVLAWQFSGGSRGAALALLILSCVLPLPLKHRPACRCHDRQSPSESTSELQTECKPSGSLIERLSRRFYSDAFDSSAGTHDTGNAVPTHRPESPDST